MATSPYARPRVSAGPTRHVYDVLVIGGQLGGLLSACLLAKRGCRVLCVEHDGVGGGYEHGGFMLPYAPFLAPALKVMPGVEEAFAELGIQTSYQRALRPHQPELQLVLEDARIDVSADASKWQRELTRIFAEHGPEVGARIAALTRAHEGTDAFFKAAHPLPPDGFFDRWKLSRQARATPALSWEPPARDTSAEKLMGALLPFVSNLATPDAPLARARVLSQALSLPGRHPQGREGVRELLEKRLVELGGDYLQREGNDNFVVEQLSFEGGKLEGARLVRSENVYRAAAVVVATDSGALRRLLPEKKRHRKLTEALDASEVKSFLFTVNHVLPTRALPRGMGELLLVDSGDEELGAVLVQLHPARKVDGKEDEALQVVCAGAFVPANVREFGEAHLESIAKRIGTVLERLMPFSAPHRVLASSPYLHASTARGSRLLPHPLFAFEEEKALGVGGLAQRTAVKNLFLANREVLPGLGLEGELLAGIRVSRLIQTLLDKKNPLKK